MHDTAMHKKQAMVIRHLGFEDLGTLRPILESRNYHIRYVEAGDALPTLAEVSQTDLLVILGGPISVYDTDQYPFLIQELELIQARLITRKPILGICLGAQLIARQLGAEVQSMSAGKEIGFSPLQLTREGQQSALNSITPDIQVLHWHGDQYSIPAQATLLAGTPHCPHQAFSVGNHILCLQFHLEFEASALEQWLIGHACELQAANIDLHALRLQNQRDGSQLAQAAQQVFHSWLDHAERNLSWKIS